MEGSDIHSYPNSYGSGPRTFTGFQGYQGKALYWRNGTAEYGRLSGYPLTLEPGKYTLTFAMAAWKGSPSYKANILKSGGGTVKSSPSLTATPNANGNGSADLSGAKLNSLEFEVTQKGNYIIQFQRTSGGYDEYLLLECRLKADATTGIATNTIHYSLFTSKAPGIYSPSGVRRSALQRGLNIIIDANGQVKKVLVK